MAAGTRIRLRTACAALALASLAASAAAEPSRLVELEGLATWLEGDAAGCAITEEGALVLPPARSLVWQQAATAFSAAAPFGDGLVLARAGGGELVMLLPDGKLRPLADLKVAGVSALVAAPGGVWATTLGEARVMWVTAHGAVREVAAPAARYIWSACADGDDAVLLACGEPGVVLRVRRDGAIEQVHRFEQAHLRSIVSHPRRGVFVGGGERGVLFALAEGKARALVDTGLAEVTALAVDDAAVYVAGVSGAAALLLAGDEEGGKPPEVRSQVLRVDVRGRVEVLAGSTDEAALALALDPAGALLVATGSVQQPAPHGRLYAIEPAHRALRLLMESPSRRLTHLVAGSAGRLWTVAAAGGRIEQLAPRLAGRGTFVSAPVDAGMPAQLGSVEALGAAPAATTWTVAARGGHTQRPDATWSAWSAAAPASPAHALQLPSARFFQVRLQLAGDGRATPVVRQLRLALRRHNLPPILRQVMVLRQGVALQALPREDNKGKVVAVGEPSGDDGRDELRSGRAGPQRARQVPERGALALRWAAEDPNGDELRYALMVRPLSGGEWRTLREDLAEPFCTLRTSQFADGRYVFRVRACDGLDNPDGEGACDQRDSQVVTIDHTPPTLSALRVEVAGDTAVVRGEVVDNLGPLSELTYALDHGAPRPLLPRDGVLDGPREAFTLRLGGLSPGDHVLVVRAVDGSDNAALATTTVTVPAPSPR